MQNTRTSERLEEIGIRLKRTLGQSALKNQQGFALVTAIIISVAVFVLITGMLYFATKSTTMSGVGKRYATACEAADGLAEIMKDAIMHSDSPPAGVPAICSGSGENYNFSYAVGTQSTPCTMSLTLPGAVGTIYQALVNINMTAIARSGGYSAEFPPRGYAGGGNGTSEIFRIDLKVTGPNNTQCENSILYRYFN